MKKRTFLASIVTIALCLSLIAGSTFALFTSSTDVDIAVDAGRVNITAGLTAPVLYSVTPDDGGTEIDENGNPYKYVQQPADTFANGGRAVLGTINPDGSVNADSGIITLLNVTPGDKIEFDLTGLNDSDVAVQYRYKFECIDGYDLMSGFVVTVNGTKYASMASYASTWEPLAVKANIPAAKLALELPVSAGNEFQELSAQIKVTVEAVQANADVSDTDKVTVKYITTVKDEAELLSKIYADEILHIFVRDDFATPVVLNKNLTNKTIDANGKDVHIKFEGTDTAPILLTNVEVTNLATETINISSNVNGNLAITNSKFTTDAKLGSAGFNAFISGRGTADDNLAVSVENCEFNGQFSATGDKITDYAVYFMNISNLSIRNCKINNTKSWAVQANGTGGNFVISDSVFNGCTGLLKGAIAGGSGSGSLSGNFTFANNKIVNCEKKPYTANKTPVYMNLTPIAGTITFSNNTVDDIVVKVEDMGMLG